MVKKVFHEIFNRQSFMDFVWITLGCLIQAVGMVLFMIPANLISGGVSGLAQVIRHYSGWPIGLMTVIGNIPILALGWRYLGRLKFAVRTIAAILLCSLFTDLLTAMTAGSVVTQDILLNTVFGAVITGVGYGMVYLGEGTSGGTDILARILNRRLGIPIAYASLITDTLPIFLGAFIFGWELGLYALIVIYVSGKAAEVVSEGQNNFRQFYIISKEYAAISQRIMEEMEHGTTLMKSVGGFTGEEKLVIFCVINRSEVNTLKRVVAECDPDAFVVMGQANEVLGEGFRQNRYYD